MEKENQKDKIPPIIDQFLEKEKKEKNGWIYATGFYAREGELDKAYDLIQEAKKYFRRDSLILQQERYLHHQKFVLPNRSLLAEAMNNYNNKNYEKALLGFENYLEKVPADQNVMRLRAFTNYYLNDHEASIEAINDYISAHGEDGSLINLRGVCLRSLNDMDGACADFKKSMEMGTDNGKTNYERFCKDRE